MPHRPGARPDPRYPARGVKWIWPLPFALLLLIIVVDVATPGFLMLSWIVLVPGFSAAVCGVRTTALYALLAVAVYVLADLSWVGEYDTYLPDFVFLVVAGVLATAVCGIRVRATERLAHMDDIAETTSRIVLRGLPPHWSGLEHDAVYLAADSMARVGGDFYDIQPSPHGTRVLLGDVQGKGLASVEAAAALLGAFREAGYHERDLATVAGHLETRMLRQRGYAVELGRDEGDRFATAVLLNFPALAKDILRPSEPRAARDGDGTDVAVIVLGHEPPLVVGPDGVRVLPPGDGLPLGLADLAPCPGPPRPCRLRLAPDETLLMTTDGVTEARDGEGVFFPLREVVAAAVAADPGVAAPGRLVQLVLDRTLEHCGGHLQDDTTVFAVRVGPRDREQSS